MKQGITIQERKDLRTEQNLKLEKLAAATEIYVDGVATSHFKDFNSLLEVLREQVLSKYQPVGEDTALKALEGYRKKIISAMSRTGLGTLSSMP